MKPQYKTVKDLIGDFKDALAKIEDHTPSRNNDVIGYELAEEYNNIANELKEFENIDEAAADHLTRMRALASANKKDPQAIKHALGGAKNLVASLRKKAAKEKGFIARGAAVASVDKAKSDSAIGKNIKAEAVSAQKQRALDAQRPSINKAVYDLNLKHGYDTFTKAAQGGAELTKKLKKHNDENPSKTFTKKFGVVKATKNKKNEEQEFLFRKIGLAEQSEPIESESSLFSQEYLTFFKQASGLEEREQNPFCPSRSLNHKYVRQISEEVQDFEDEDID